MVVSRFAPAPTGHLHLGHVVNALHVWGITRALKGRVLLRIEDHDRQRSRGVYEQSILDDLDWLDPGPAGCALYQLAAALPLGAEQRELGRRVLSRLLAGSAATFAAISALMARAGGKGLTSPPVFARVSLLVELPLALGVNDGALALGIASRRQLARDYVQTRSTRSLSERRLAARLLERAAREAVRRASLGDRSALRLVGPDGPLEAVHKRLFMDREPLVWRHVAVARGILLPFWEAGCVSLEEELGPSQTPTEWRRAAAALGGVAVSKPDLAVRLAHSPDIERKTMLGELAKVNRTRIERMLGPEGGYDNYA